MIINDLYTRINDLCPLVYFKIHNFASDTRRQLASSRSIFKISIQLDYKNS